MTICVADYTRKPYTPQPECQPQGAELWIYGKARPADCQHKPTAKHSAREPDNLGRGKHCREGAAFDRSRAHPLAGSTRVEDEQHKNLPSQAALFTWFVDSTFSVSRFRSALVPELIAGLGRGRNPFAALDDHYASVFDFAAARPHFNQLTGVGSSLAWFICRHDSSLFRFPAAFLSV